MATHARHAFAAVILLLAACPVASGQASVGETKKETKSVPLQSTLKADGTRLAELPEPVREKIMQDLSEHRVLDAVIGYRDALKIDTDEARAAIELIRARTAAESKKDTDKKLEPSPAEIPDDPERSERIRKQVAAAHAHLRAFKAGQLREYVNAISTAGKILIKGKHAKGPIEFPVLIADQAPRSAFKRLDFMRADYIITTDDPPPVNKGPDLRLLQKALDAEPPPEGQMDQIFRVADAKSSSLASHCAGLIQPDGSVTDPAQVKGENRENLEFYFELTVRPSGIRSLIERKGAECNSLGFVPFYRTDESWRPKVVVLYADTDSPIGTYVTKDGRVGAQANRTTRMVWIVSLTKGAILQTKAFTATPPREVTVQSLSPNNDIGASQDVDQQMKKWLEGLTK